MASKKITITLANGDKATGTRLDVPGYEHLELLFCKAGEGIKGHTVYECKTGMRLFPITVVVMTKDDTIEQALHALRTIDKDRANEGGFDAMLQAHIDKWQDGKPLNTIGPVNKQRRLL